MSQPSKRKTCDLKLSIPPDNNSRFGTYNTPWPLLQQPKKRKLSEQSFEMNTKNFETKKKVTFSDDVSISQ